MELLNKNLDNIKSDTDLFGNKIEKLSMKDRIGFLPISIWEPDWTTTKQLKEIIGDSAETRGESSYGFQDTQSIFNPHLAQMILSAYCPANSRIYDPFAGGGTRAFIASAMGHKYYGVELRQDEVERIIEKRKKLEKDFHIRVGDSRNFEFDNNSFDFSYTCPPYYNLEVYSELAEDMSNAKTYTDFLAMLKDSMQGVYNGLKKDHLSVWVVGNFRDKKGNLVSFSSDLVKIAQECGFALHDEIIFWGASKAAAQRCGHFQANRKSVRVHEYILIFKK